MTFEKIEEIMDIKHYRIMTKSFPVVKSMKKSGKIKLHRDLREVNVFLISLLWIRVKVVLLERTYRWNCLNKRLMTWNWLKTHNKLSTRHYTSNWFTLTLFHWPYLFTWPFSVAAAMHIRVFHRYVSESMSGIPSTLFMRQLKAALFVYNSLFCLCLFSAL